MAKGFDINKIKIKSQREENLSKLLTGEVTMGLDPNSKVNPNAELENEEYLKYPDNKVQKVEGATHENGGVKMQLPGGTQVISDSLKLKKGDVKMLSKEFEINLSEKDTYASALDKYTKKIGLSKINDEQEEVFEQLKKEIEKATKDGTKRVNNEYLSKKIYDLESKKQPLENKRKDFFDTVFQLQEAQKPQQPEEEEETFKYGGLTGDSFNKLCQQHGLTVEQGIAALGPNLAMFSGGGEMYNQFKARIGEYKGEWTQETFNNSLASHLEDQRMTSEEVADLRELWKNTSTTPVTSKSSEKLKSTQGTNAFSTEAVIPQRAGKEVYGTEKDPLKIIQNLYKNFPDIVSDKEVFGNFIDVENGVVSWKEGKKIPLNTKLTTVLKFQEKANERMNSSAEYIIKNPEKFDVETVKKAEAYRKTETFTGAKSKGMTTEAKVRSNDQMMGNFTAGRTGLGLDVVTPEENKALQSKGKFTINQITDEDLATLSPDTQARIKNVRDGKPESADYSLNEYTPEQVVKVEKEKEKEKSATIKEDNIVIPEKVYPKLFMTPDQSVLPPSAQTPETLIKNRFQRIDPIRVGKEDVERNNAESLRFATSQLEALPPSQRAAMLGSLLSKTQQSENTSGTEINRINAQNISAAEQFNIGQSDRENIAEGSNLLNFEGRTLTAQAKTEADLRNYLNYNHKVALNNFQNQQKLNLMNSLYPEFDLNYTGTGIEFDPNTLYQIRDNRNAQLVQNYTQQSPVTTTDPDKIQND